MKSLRDTRHPAAIPSPVPPALACSFRPGVRAAAVPIDEERGDLLRFVVALRLDLLLLLLNCRLRALDPGGRDRRLLLRGQTQPDLRHLEQSRARLLGRDRARHGPAFLCEAPIVLRRTAHRGLPVTAVPSWFVPTRCRRPCSNRSLLSMTIRCPDTIVTAA